MKKSIKPKRDAQVDFVCQSMKERGHVPQAFSMFASAVLDPGNKSNVEAFCSAFRERRWGDLMAFQEWDRAKDNMEAYAVKCETGCVLLVAISHFELFFGNCVYRCEHLPVDEGSSLVSLVPEKNWRKLAD